MEFYRFDRHSGATEQMPANENGLLDALGYYQGTNYLYMHGLNRIQPAGQGAGNQLRFRHSTSAAGATPAENQWRPQPFGIVIAAMRSGNSPVHNEQPMA